MELVKTYSELSKLKTFEERFKYLKENGKVGEETFGFNRYINQAFYTSKEWKDARRKVIIRDNGNDLGIEGRPAGKKIIVHHMNNITEDDIINKNEKIYDPEYLITLSLKTHNAIHYGDESILQETKDIERKPNDQCPWKK